LSDRALQLCERALATGLIVGAVGFTSLRHRRQCTLGSRAFSELFFG
jgi:hypothetical protein